MIKLSVIQLNATPSIERNVAAIETQLATLAPLQKKMPAAGGTTKHNHKRIEHIVALPECCLFFGGLDQAQLSLAEKSQINNDLQQILSRLASKYQVTFIGGTIPILTDDGKKFTNSSCVFDVKGTLIGRYDKIHLFDVNIEDNEKTYSESRYTQAGKSPCLVKTPFANIGLTVCFDLRFPLLFQKLTAMGADIITVPSAFTCVTGKAHWQALLQARAIENQVYIMAAGQEGRHENGRETWGHSMIISPWGEILTTLVAGEGIISCEFLPEEIKRIRTSMPLLHTADT